MQLTISIKKQYLICTFIAGQLFYDSLFREPKLEHIVEMGTKTTFFQTLFREPVFRRQHQTPLYFNTARQHNCVKALLVSLRILLSILYNTSMVHVVFPGSLATPLLLYANRKDIRLVGAGNQRNNSTVVISGFQVCQVMHVLWTLLFLIYFLRFMNRTIKYYKQNTRIKLDTEDSKRMELKIYSQIIQI